MTYGQGQQERRELLNRKKLAAGLVADRYPAVSRIVLRMTYFQKASSAALMVRTINFIPTDYAYFHVDCMHEGCTNGGFDLAPVIAGMIKARSEKATGKIYCSGKKGELQSHHASISYEVSIQGAPATNNKSKRLQ